MRDAAEQRDERAVAERRVREREAGAVELVGVRERFVRGAQLQAKCSTCDSHRYDYSNTKTIRIEHCCEYLRNRRLESVVLCSCGYTRRKRFQSKSVGSRTRLASSTSRMSRRNDECYESKRGTVQT